MKKKIMILGASGMAGHTIADYLRSTEKYEELCLIDKNEEYITPTYIIDVEKDLEELKDIIDTIKPDIIINCIGLLVKACESHQHKGVWINSLFPHFLSKFDSKIIHLSTDCVFSGKRGLYEDTDRKDGKGWYALTKAIGEIINNKDLTIRMSIIGRELKDNGTGLFEWFMRQKGTIKGYDRAYWTGVTTLELAKAIDKLIDSNITGLYQLAFPHVISKYELIKLIAKIWNKTDITIERDIVNFHDKSLINSKHRIPNYKMPESYEKMLEEYYEWGK